MQSFTVHWSLVPTVETGMALFALWPSPVNPDVCFREAGFTDFGDGDEWWENEADSLLTRLLVALSRYGPPRLISEPIKRHDSWFRRLFSKTKPYDLCQQIELPIQWDSLPDCIVSFGQSGISLRTGSGHRIFWISLPLSEAAAFSNLVGEIAGPHPILRTELKWECLL